MSTGRRVYSPALIVGGLLGSGLVSLLFVAMLYLMIWKPGL